MDILDIDEALKDDSFIFLEDKTHDDISNILQQWKSNNCIPPSHNAQQQQESNSQQAYKLDSRTFTRPKRKTAQNLEPQFVNSQYKQQKNVANGQAAAAAAADSTPMLNLEIGGLVTNMQKSFLHDVSPPSFSSISMDESIDRMNNSLITSADFSNVNFLQSTNSLDFTEKDNLHDFNFSGKITSDGYTLSDMIRDRKALESLTMSGDGTLIKDSHIGQIDDISLTMSKTASGCSTMNNSTESVDEEGVNNRTVEIAKHTFDEGVHLELARQTVSGTKENQNTFGILSDEMIGDITYSLVENSMYGSVAPITTEQELNVTHRVGDNAAVKDSDNKPPVGLDETVCLSAGAGGKTCNSTFECQQNVTPDTRCETPEAIEKTVAAMKFYESTPQASSVRYNKQQYTPSLKMVTDVTISPIVAITTNAAANNVTRVLTDTFDNEPKIQNVSQNVDGNTFSGKLPAMTSTEMIENIENPNSTFSKVFKHGQHQLQSPASLEMKSVMDLAQAEANLLASNNNEEEFDHMLDEFSKVELNAEQLKMKKSLDSIKKRFNYGPHRDKSQREISREAKDMRDMMRTSADVLGDENATCKDYLNMTVDLLTKNHNEADEHPLVELQQMSSGEAHELIKDSVTNSSISDSKSSLVISNGLSNSSASNASSSSGRLLGLRGRLYDDINISNISNNSNSVHGHKPSLSISFTIRKEDNANSETDLLMNNQQNALEIVQEKTESPTENVITDVDCKAAETISSEAAQYKLAEKRERDRDRFKTIKIIKNRSAGDGGDLDTKLNVPCIDDDYNDQHCENQIPEQDQQTQIQQYQCKNPRFSRRDQSIGIPSAFNNPTQDGTEPHATTANNNATSNCIPNYKTFKKPKDKQSNTMNLPEISPAEIIAPPLNPPSARSLSRPRYLSGLSKLSAVSKAISADQLEKSAPQQNILNSTISIAKETNFSSNTIRYDQTSNGKMPVGGELKSPMGIKSKSFHNLSNNLAYASASNTSGISNVGGLPAPRTFGLRKPSASGVSTEKLAKKNPNRHSAVITSATNQQQLPTQQKSEDALFKVPKLVSGIRAPGAVQKRAGLARPSSGYYSLNVNAKSVQQDGGGESDNGRHSPSDSMSSASSKGSIQNINKTIGIKVPSCSSNAGLAPTIKSITTNNLTKITISSTGIPKPSGLRPPSNIKRSGLPRPASYVKP